MSIEQTMQSLTEALNANTAALRGVPAAAGAAPASATSNGAGKGKAAAAPAVGGVKREHTRNEIIAVLNEVKDKLGTAAAKKLIKDKGGAERIAEVPEGNFNTLYNAAKAALGGGAAEDEGDGGDGL